MSDYLNRKQRSLPELRAEVKADIPHVRQFDPRACTLISTIDLIRRIDAEIAKRR